MPFWVDWNQSGLRPGWKCQKVGFCLKSSRYQWIKQTPTPSERHHYSNIISTWLPLYTVCLVSETCENFHQISTSLYHAALLQLELWRCCGSFRMVQFSSFVVVVQELNPVELKAILPLELIHYCEGHCNLAILWLHPSLCLDVWSQTVCNGKCTLIRISESWFYNRTKWMTWIYFKAH